ncbi:hypothetical protein SMD22_01860 (plasmid) [Brevibacillus halotolerans]|nr:hypothetical protein SMD22_01860 [Brevibacillus halotolerans]
MISQEWKREILRIYGDMLRHEIIEHSLFSMGNVAYFADRCLSQTNNQKVKKMMVELIVSKRKQDLFFFLAKNIYECAIKEGIEENLDYRINRVIEKYKKKTLNHFEILLDEYHYPEWFKRYIPFVKTSDPQGLYKLLIAVVQSKPTFEQQMNKEDYLTKTHIFVHRVCKNSMKWQYVLSLVDAYYDEDREKVLKLFAFKLL